MKFSEMKYTRPSMEEIGREYDEAIEKLKNAPDAAAAAEAVLMHEKILKKASTAASLAGVRHSIDTRDEFYDAENTYMDGFFPLFEQKMQEFIRLLLDSRHRPALEKRFSKLLFTNAEMQNKCFSPLIVGLLQEENKLVSEYEKLMASAQIPFDGKILNISQLVPYKQSGDRAVRKAAFEAEGGFYADNGEALDRIYDDLVRLRTEIGRKLGYKNFTPVGYMRMQRNCYTPEMAANFRRQVLNDIVPVAARLKEMQRARIGVGKLMYYDDTFVFKEGNPVPRGTAEDILAAGKKMYEQMSAETGEFINVLYGGGLIDAVAKPGKSVGGFCTEFPDYGLPFIFSNFNGTSGDVEVLTHEAGHAFAFYTARDSEIMETASPSLDACEIHSMSMEFFAWPWLGLYYGEDSERAKLAHLASCVTFIPYGVMVDEFQHIVYDNPELTPAQRHEEWKKLDAKYRPYMDYGDLTFFSDGRSWQRQSHIYQNPFYYIDYCLAQTAALEFWALDRKDHRDAWERYMRLVRRAGGETFTGLCACAGIKSPFEDGSLKGIARAAEEYLSRG